MKKDLELMARAYNLGEKLSLDDYDIDEFMKSCEEKGISGTWEDLCTILERGIKVKEKLSFDYESCSLNNHYENFGRRWDSNGIGLRVRTNYGEDVNIIIEIESYEVCDQENVDETDEMFDSDELDNAVEYAASL